MPSSDGPIPTGLSSDPESAETWVRTPLLNLTAIGDRLGVSRQRAAQLAHEHPLFPAPVEADKPLYEQAAVEVFADVWERKTGRPAGKPAPLST